jgi:hypothetical protein
VVEREKELVDLAFHVEARRERVGILQDEHALGPVPRQVNLGADEADRVDRAQSASDVLHAALLFGLLVHHAFEKANNCAGGATALSVILILHHGTVGMAVEGLVVVGDGRHAQALAHGGVREECGVGLVANHGFLGFTNVIFCMVLVRLGYHCWEVLPGLPQFRLESLPVFVEILPPIQPLLLLQTHMHG